MSLSEPNPTPELARPGRMTGLLVLAAALAAGLAAWGLGEFNLTRFDTVLTLEDSLANRVYGQKNASVTKTAALSYGILAGLSGLLIGMAGGVASGNLRRGLLGGLVGMVVGAAAASGASYGLVPYFKAHYNPDTEDLLLPMAMHGAIWAAAGLAGGLALGIALGGRSRCVRLVIGGIVGALIGTAAYEVIGALAFATQKTIEPIAEGLGSRGLGYLAVTLGIGLVLAGTLHERRAKPAA